MFIPISDYRIKITPIFAGLMNMNWIFGRVLYVAMIMCFFISIDTTQSYDV